VELPHAESLYRELKDQGLALVTVTQDAGASVLKMVTYNGITHPIVSDTAKVYENYHAYDGKHYLIGPDGTILAAFSKLGVSIPILKRELAKHGVAPASAPGAAVPRVMLAQAARPGTVGAPPPVVWSGPVAALTATAGSKLPVNITAAIGSGWHIYALTQAAGGPTPLKISMPDTQPFKLAGTIVSSKPEVIFDPGFGIDVHHLKGRAEFTLPVVVSKAAPGRRTMAIEARYQACNATLCLPAKTDRLEVPVVIK
jgi:hypothetical protein